MSHKIYHPGSYEEFSSFLDNRSFSLSFSGRPYSLLDEVQHIVQAYTATFSRKHSFTYYDGLNVFIGYLDCATFLSMTSVSSFDLYVNIFLLEDKVIDLSDVETGNYSISDIGSLASSILSERYNLVIGVLKPLEKKSDIYHAVNFFPSIKISHAAGEIKTVRGIFDDGPRKRNVLNLVYSNDPYIKDVVVRNGEGVNYFELSDYGFLINSNFPSIDINYNYLSDVDKIPAAIKMLYFLSTVDNLLLWEKDSIGLMHFLVESSFPVMENGVCKTVNLAKIHGHLMLKEICKFRNFNDSYYFLQKTLPEKVMSDFEVFPSHLIEYLLTEKVNNNA